MTDLRANPGVASTLPLVGDIDVLNAHLIEDAARAALDDGATELHVDLAAVTFMDSQGLNALMQAHRSFTAIGGGLVLRNVPHRVQRTLSMTGLDRVLNVVEA